MAEAVVAGAFLAGFINVVFDRLISPEAVNLIKGKKLDPELVERLKIALLGAKALLADAERKQFDNPQLKMWLDSLKDAVYKADDSLDHVLTKAATEKMVSTSLPRFLNLKDKKIVNEIEVEVRRIEYLKNQKDDLGLKSVAGDNYSSGRTPSTSLVKGTIYGREGDQQAIMKIINDQSQHHQLSVIPIVGIGGVGKTTLAQLVYGNDDLELKGFDLKAWVCISEEFDIVKVSKTIIKGITKSTCDLEDFNSLQLDLKEKLSTRKFFIVLDDIWSDDRQKWNDFKTPFEYGVRGSTILVTTRSKDVASVVQSCSPYFLDGLSDDYCWSVFSDKADLPESNGSSDLEEIGRKIVKKCKGLPLVAETIGCILRTERAVEKWKKILLSGFWEISVENSKIIPALLISYYHLPAHLKGCFIYCSLFPKDHEFHKDELILLWMAEDLLRRPHGGETLEEVGNECFDNLASRLFFKKITKLWNDEVFVMHDLLHDLSLFLAGDFYCRLEELGKAEKMSNQTRHLSYGSLSHPISKNFDCIDKVQLLRTFLQINFSRPSFNIEHTPHIILSKLKFLRVLSFSEFQELDLLPDSIGKLIHLRYLDLSKTRIKTLPESLCGLFNLQTLKLFWCYELTMLPSGMHNLVNLRHLDTRGTQLQELPKGLSKLKHLHVLGHFAVGKQKDSAGIKELAELSVIDGTLMLRNLENVSDCDEAMGARLMDKTHVDKLILKWSDNCYIVSNMQTKIDIFDKLQPHHGLKELEVYGYGGTSFPKWVGHSSYNNMTRVSLVSCRSCCILPTFGQLPSLMSLHIEYFDKLERVGAEFYKNEDDHSSSVSFSPFPSLVYLTVESMPCWEVWSPFDSNNAFPRLEKLLIRDCPRLKGDLPNHFPVIRELDMSGSDKMGLQELPLSLQRLSIRGCQQVESMFKAMSINYPTCLQYLTISDCSSVTSLPWDCLSKSLRSLIIKNCRNLEFSSQQQQQNHKLETLKLKHSCSSLTLFQLEAFPNLGHFEVEWCENLESFSLSGSESQHATLHRLTIIDCPKLASFPNEGLAAPNMVYFRIEKCKKLKSLPSHMNSLLPNLKYLTIRDCPDIDSIPEGGLPPSLTSLYVEKCEKLLSNLSSVGVHNALTDLEIDGREWEKIKSFPNEGLLPGLPSLTNLSLIGFPEMQTLECKELFLLTSLQTLVIRNCPKLGNIAGERLPHSLLVLHIIECPMLAKRCKNKHRKIWSKISHIPRIKVDLRWVS